MGHYSGLAAALALAATGAAVPAQAQGHCWEEREVTASQVREMQTMLMVATLRCQAAHIDIASDYNGFVTAQKGTLDRADLEIKRHFAAIGGQQADYDRFATSLANRFGDDETNESSCAEAAALADDATVATPAALEALAIARVFPTVLPDGACSMLGSRATLKRAASNEETLPAFIPLAPPPALSAPVALPADVIAAMTVMARFQTGQAAAMPGPAAVSTPTQFATVQR